MRDAGAVSACVNGGLERCLGESRKPDRLIRFFGSHIGYMGAFPGIPYSQFGCQTLYEPSGGSFILKCGLSDAENGKIMIVSHYSRVHRSPDL